MEAEIAADAFVKNTKDAVVVLGMHRSGTSAMARVLSLAGAQLPASTMPPGLGNPAGHWEPRDIADFNDRIFADLDSGWHDPFGPRGLRRRKLPNARYLAEAQDILLKNYGESSPIVLKEPRLSVLFDLWIEALNNRQFKPCYIIMVRHPFEVAASLKARDSFLENKSIILWTTYMLTCELNTRDANRIFVSYDDLLENPEAILDKVESQLALNLPRRTWDSLLETQEFLRRDLKHHDLVGARPELPGFGEVTRFYDFLKAASQGEPWNADVSAEVAAWLEELEAAVGPMLKQTERQLRMARSDAHIEREQAAAARAALETAANDFQAAQFALADTQHRLADREADLGQQLSRAEADSHAARQQIVEIEASLAQAGVNMSALQARLDQQSARTEADAQAAQDQIAHLEASLAGAQEQSAQLEAALADAQRKIAGDQAEFDQRSVQAEADAHAALEQIAELEAALAALDDQLAQTAAESQSNRAQAAQLKESLANAASELNATREQANSHRATVTALEIRLGQSAAAAQAKLDEARDKTATLETYHQDALAALNAKDSELNEQRGRAELQLQAAQDQAAALAQALAQSVIDQNRPLSIARLWADIVQWIRQLLAH